MVVVVVVPIGRRVTRRAGLCGDPMDGGQKIVVILVIIVVVIVVVVVAVIVAAVVVVLGRQVTRRAR